MEHNKIQDELWLYYLQGHEKLSHKRVSFLCVPFCLRTQWLFVKMCYNKLMDLTEFSYCSKIKISPELKLLQVLTQSNLYLWEGKCPIRAVFVWILTVFPCVAYVCPMKRRLYLP